MRVRPLGTQCDPTRHTQYTYTQGGEGVAGGFDDATFSRCWSRLLCSACAPLLVPLPLALAEETQLKLVPKVGLTQTCDAIFNAFSMHNGLLWHTHVPLAFYHCFECFHSIAL